PPLPPLAAAAVPDEGFQDAAGPRRLARVVSGAAAVDSAGTVDTADRRASAAAEAIWACPAPGVCVCAESGLGRAVALSARGRDSVSGVAGTGGLALVGGW